METFKIVIVKAVITKIITYAGLLGPKIWGIVPLNILKWSRKEQENCQGRLERLKTNVLCPNPDVKTLAKTISLRQQLINPHVNAFQGPSQQMDSPGKATAHMTTSYLNRRVWIQSVSRRRKIGRKAGISSQRAQGMMFPTELNCKVRSSCIIVLFAQTAPPPLTLVMLHHDVHCWVAASYKHILAEHWAKIRFPCLHKVLRATKTIINRTWKIRRRDVPGWLRDQPGIKAQIGSAAGTN